MQSWIKYQSLVNLIPENPISRTVPVNAGSGLGKLRSINQAKDS